VAKRQGSDEDHRCPNVDYPPEDIVEGLTSRGGTKFGIKASSLSGSTVIPFTITSK
jgi:hypothetical protein